LSTLSIANSSQIRDLGLTDELLITPKSSPAARNRFVYYPDHLVKIPGAGDDVYSIFWRLITEPAFTGLVTGGLREPFQPERASDIADESIASFLNRRFGSSYPVDNLVSAVLHGIFAGDVYQLSARSLALPRWSDEIRHGSICGGLYERWRTGRETYSYKDLWSMLRSNGIGSDEFRLYFDEHFKDASVYSFKGGIGTLSDALDKSLRANPKVTFKMSTEVKKVEAADDGIQVSPRLLFNCL
jgi:oxygen-dependent protoporphyrinogen oxidase